MVVVASPLPHRTALRMRYQLLDLHSTLDVPRTHIPIHSERLSCGMAYHCIVFDSFFSLSLQASPGHGQFSRRFALSRFLGFHLPSHSRTAFLAHLFLSLDAFLSYKHLAERPWIDSLFPFPLLRSSPVLNYPHRMPDICIEPFSSFSCSSV